MPENQTAWNSDNQGVKETFTRPVGGTETGSHAARRAERTQGKAEDHASEAGLAEQ